MMKSSAKILFTLVAAGALGAVAIACTVSSGTVDDVDGGSSSGQASSSSSGGASSSSGGASSSSSGTVETCPAAKIDINDNDSADCKACLRNSCCSQITAYEDKGADEPDSGLLGTDNYAVQLGDCDEHDGPDDCKALVKQTPPTQQGVPAIYDAYLSCRTTSCATQCAGVAEADAGSK